MLGGICLDHLMYRAETNLVRRLPTSSPMRTAPRSLHGRITVLRDTGGGSAAEYIIAAAVIALVAMAAFRVFGVTVREKVTAEANCVRTLSSSCKGSEGSNLTISG